MLRHLYRKRVLIKEHVKLLYKDAVQENKMSTSQRTQDYLQEQKVKRVDTLPR